MFGAKKLTADDLAAALDPKIMSDLSSEMQNPTAAKRLVRETAEYFGSQKDWFTGKKARNEVIKEFERIVAGETIKAEMCRKDLARLSSMHSKGEFDVLLQDADNVLEPSEYGVIDGDDDVTRAAKWICKCSGTLRGDGVATVRDVIKKGVSSKEPLTIEAVDRMWRELVPVPSHRVRHIAESAIPLLCDKVGHVKMENAITMKTGADDSRDKAFYLMSTIIRAHGYPDGNGRVARVVYAVSQLRGLPDVAQSPAKTTWVQEGHGRYRKVVDGGQPAARFVAPTKECATALTTL